MLSHSLLSLLLGKTPVIIKNWGQMMKTETSCHELRRELHLPLGDQKIQFRLFLPWQGYEAVNGIWYKIKHQDKDGPQWSRVYRKMLICFNDR